MNSTTYSANDNGLGAASIVVEGERASVTLTDFGLESYRTWIALKSALPRVEATGRTITFPASDLVRLGIDTRTYSGSQLPDRGPLFADQHYVLDVALRRKRFAAFCEAGWGKTVTYLAWAREVSARTHGGKVLIVTPLKVLPQTIEEARKFWPGETPPLNLREFPGGLQAWLADATAHPIAVVNIDVFKSRDGTLDLSGLKGFVLDESSVLKAMAGVTRNVLVRAVEPVDYRLACSATPAPNELDEYVSHALFLGAVKNHKEFFADYFSSDSEGGWNLRPYAKEAFFAFMASWSIWMRNPARYGFPDRLGEIPAPKYYDTLVDVTDEQTREARHHRREGSLFLDNVGVAKRSKLAQISRGFVYETEGKTRRARPIASLKPSAIADAVCSHPGERSVVWVTFDEETRLVAGELRDRGLKVVIVDGDTDEDASMRAVHDLNAGAVDVLVAKPATMGFGLNLQGASVVVFSGISDSFEMDYQAVRRCLRFGQTKPVHVHYVCTSFESPMLDNVRRKRAAWEEQATELERAYVASCGADLAVFRGAKPPESHRTRHTLSQDDLRALSRVTMEAA